MATTILLSFDALLQYVVSKTQPPWPNADVASVSLSLSRSLHPPPPTSNKGLEHANSHWKWLFGLRSNPTTSMEGGWVEGEREHESDSAQGRVYDYNSLPFLLFN